MRFTADIPAAVTRKKRFERPPRSGVGSPRRDLDVPLCLQPIKGSVNGANGYFTFRAQFNLLPHRNPIGAIFEPQKRQHDDVLEFAEVIAAGHYLYNI